ncbi:MAG: serine/threonine-protein kinase [Burkholderiales bacterium]
MKPARIGRYVILDELGRGAMGIVYKARDPLIDRLVALKTVGVEAHSAEADAYRQRFFREARSAGGLSHPNIVTVHDVGEGDGVAYIAMEFLPGQSLRQILDSGAVLPFARIADIAAQVADGLAFAHAKGVVHRDVKPANVMVLDSGLVKITDFGIARLPSGTRTIAGTVYGSPKYMSPERVRGEEVDGRTDIFSLGAMLYEMLTGVAPFTATDLPTILDQILHVMPEPPSQRNRDIPPAFDVIVARALAKDRADRYADAQQMADALRHFADPVPAAAPAAPAGERPALLVRPAGEPQPRATTAQEAASPMFIAPRPEPLPSADRAAKAPAPRWRTMALIGVPLIGIAALALWLAAPSRPPKPPPATPIAAPTPLPAPAPIAASEPAQPAPATGAAAPARPAAPAATSAPPPPALAQASAQLGFAISPWGEVYVNGRKAGISPPLVELRLPPGKYAVEIRNATFPPFRTTVELRAQESIKLRHKFQ